MPVSSGTLGQTPQVKPSPQPVAANSSSPNAEASHVSADPAPAEPTSYWNQPWATGDWGGRRLELLEKGINFDFSFTQFVQAMSDADDSFDHYVNRFDAYLNVDTDKAGLWKGEDIGAHFEIRFGNAPTAIAVFPANAALVTPTSGAGQGQLTSLYVTQKLGKASSLMVGKINTLDLHAGAPFMGGRGIDGFMHIAFAGPPSGVAPVSTYGGLFSTRFKKKIRLQSFRFRSAEPNRMGQTFYRRH